MRSYEQLGALNSFESLFHGQSQVLLPFQAMILFGLAGLPSLPFPLFSYAFSMMDFLENYSYAATCWKAPESPGAIFRLDRDHQ